MSVTKLNYFSNFILKVDGTCFNMSVLNDQDKYLKALQNGETIIFGWMELKMICGKIKIINKRDIEF